ncbi:hypothetical protein Q9K01_02275 [Qipengyuania sp. DY56-A-20]|jgi:hypothetical protein|uniref:Uncharacterized protein n=1 Tax=Qipengyuania benthica TaxID=3067651 RepID=A0ABT9H561_9SPHN|nr:hypothetical protein [Qipengyuania sp. DY56-A-20]MBU1253268.1 hypothetical protein [Alphaproteobacteria bacterium]MBU1605742.1 hypothetical protein [Alphaproteobacteria bacterium]MDP4538454.1 hypothetical protein [Qipengyuania sp. DY56-A-20]
MQDFRNRHDFRTLVLAFIVWAAHFTLLWVASVTFPGEPAARWLALAFTTFALGALSWLFLRAGKPKLASVAGLGLAIATVGTIYDSIPPLIG